MENRQVIFMLALLCSAYHLLNVFNSMCVLNIDINRDGSREIRGIGTLPSWSADASWSLCRGAAHPTQSDAFRAQLSIIRFHLVCEASNLTIKTELIAHSNP